MVSDIIETVRIYIFRSIGYFIFAIFFGLLTYLYWFTSPNMLTAYIWNVMGIAVVLVVDKMRIKRIYRKMETCTDNKSRSTLMKKDISSVKTSLYLFYIFALIFSQMLAMDAPIEVSENMRGYFQSVSHGVVLLFALDKFFGYLISDDIRIRKFKDKYK